MQESNIAADMAASALDEIWRRFLSPRGFVLDYAGLAGEVIAPTREDHDLGRPNGFAWFTPTEDGAFFTGLLLAGVVRQWRAKPSSELASRAAVLADSLMTLSAVGRRDGFVARSVSVEDDSHPTIGSDDQTFPLLFGLWAFLRSGMPGVNEPAIRGRLIRLCRQLQLTGWSMPTDAGPEFGYRSSFAHFNFIHAARLLFAHRVMVELDEPNMAQWHRLYLERLHERDDNAGPSRLELLEAGMGYAHLGSWTGYPMNPHFWISASSQAALRELYDIETDPDIREVFERGLNTNARAAVAHVVACRWFDPLDASQFTTDWTFLNEYWEPQSNVEDSLRVANVQRQHWAAANPRKFYEDTFVREPLFAAWVASLATNEDIRNQAWLHLEAASERLVWSTLYTSLFFVVTLIERPSRA